MCRKTFGLFSFSVLLFSSLIALVPEGTGTPWGNPTATSIASSANPSAFGQSATLTATVTGEPVGSKPITGEVAFKEGGKIIGGIVELVNGTASLNISSLEVGQHHITATYSGDASYAPSISDVLEQSVIQPTVTFHGSPQEPLLTSNGDLLAYVTITNTGNITVNSVQVTSAKLGSASQLSTPAVITNLAAGQRAVVTLTFPSGAVSSKATNAPLRLSFAYSVKDPPLIGKSTLSFASVSLR